jgi:RNA polymerase sigma factor (sigma-70 family)
MSSEVLTPRVLAIVRRKAIAAPKALRRLGYEPADLRQEFLVQIVACADRFDGSRASFATFVSHICHNRQLHLIESGFACKRKAGSTLVSLSDPVGEADTLQLQDALAQDEYMMRTGRRSRPAAELMLLRIDVDRVVDALPAGMVEVARLLAAGERPADVAQHLGISHATVYRRIAALRAAFRAAGFDHRTYQEAA